MERTREICNAWQNMIWGKKDYKDRCRFCGMECRATTNNGIIGKGYKEWNYVCTACGRTQ